jgi:hypothetical protein
MSGDELEVAPEAEEQTGKRGSLPIWQTLGDGAKLPGDVLACAIRGHLR